MKFAVKKNFFSTLLIAFTFISCEKVTTTSTRSDKEENSGDSCTNCEEPPSNIKTGNIDKFCEDAKTIKQAELYQTYYEQYCEEGKPSKTLTQLIADAFTGSGKPNLTEFAPIKYEEGGLVSWWVAGGIKVPISAKSLVQKLRLLDAMNLPKLGFNPFQADIFSINVLSKFPKEDPFHLGGSEFSISAENVKNFPISIGFNQRADLYEFSEDVYLYATHASMPKSFVKKLDVYVAIIDIGGSAYLAPQVAVNVEDFPGIAGPSGAILKNFLEEAVTEAYQFIFKILK